MQSVKNVSLWGVPEVERVKMGSRNGQRATEIFQVLVKDMILQIKENHHDK